MNDSTAILAYTRIARTVFCLGSLAAISQFCFCKYKIPLNLSYILINKFNRSRPMRALPMCAGSKAGQAHGFLFEKNSTGKRKMWKIRRSMSVIKFRKNARSCCTICPNEVWHTCQLMKKIKSGRIMAGVLFLLTINNPPHFA